jgi:hypothetical protein
MISLAVFIMSIFVPAYLFGLSVKKIFKISTPDKRIIGPQDNKINGPLVLVMISMVVIIITSSMSCHYFEEWRVASSLKTWCDKNGHDYISSKEVDAANGRRNIAKFFWPKKYSIITKNGDHPLILFHGDWLWGAYSNETQIESP